MKNTDNRGCNDGCEGVEALDGRRCIHPVNPDALDRDLIEVRYRARESLNLIFGGLTHWNIRVLTTMILLSTTNIIRKMVTLPNVSLGKMRRKKKRSESLVKVIAPI